MCDETMEYNINPIISLILDTQERWLLSHV